MREREKIKNPLQITTPLLGSMWNSWGQAAGKTLNRMDFVDTNYATLEREREREREFYILVFCFLFFNFILSLIIFILYIWHGKTTWQKIMTWRHYWVLSWHLTERTLTNINGRVHLTAKQTYRTQITTFEIRRLKVDFNLLLFFFLFFSFFSIVDVHRNSVLIN